MVDFCRDMTEDDFVVVSSNGKLTLTSVSKDHEGEWRCQATNSSGSTEAKTKLTIIPIRGNIHTHPHTHTHKHNHHLVTACSYYMSYFFSSQIIAFPKTRS